MTLIDNRWKQTGETLGQGGQSRVYTVTDTSEEFPGEYALKLLRNAGSPQAYQRFRKEISALHDIVHPNIIKTIYHSSKESKQQYYVMEYLPGSRSLKSLIAKENNFFKEDAKACVDLFIQIVSALDFCERMNTPILHRDLSPANILITSDKKIKIIDFGLCQIPGTEIITLVDEGVGTQNYLAPECESGAVGRTTIASDLYSAGKIIWTAVTGLMAFAREKPVYEDKSMENMFPEHQELWHLQRIFEHTIRHYPKNRWDSAWQAMSYTQHFRKIIIEGKPPLEKVWASCPICGIGKFENTLRPTEIYHGVLPEGFLSVQCNTCGYCCLVNNNKYLETLKTTRALE